MFEPGGKVTVRVHFDGNHLVLDEPADLPVGKPLVAEVSEPGPKRAEELSPTERAAAFMSWAGTWRSEAPQGYVFRREDAYPDE